MEVPRVVEKIVETVIEVPKVIYQDRVVEKVIEVPQIQVVEKIVHVPVVEK